LTRQVVVLKKEKNTILSMNLWPCIYVDWNKSRNYAVILWSSDFIHFMCKSYFYDKK